MEQQTSLVNTPAEENTKAMGDRKEELTRQLLEARSQLHEQNEDAKKNVLEQKSSMASAMAMLESLANDASSLRVKLEHSEQQCTDARGEAEQATVRCFSLEAELVGVKKAASDVEDDLTSRLAISEETLKKCQLELNHLRAESRQCTTKPQHSDNLSEKPWLSDGHVLGVEEVGLISIKSSPWDAEVIVALSADLNDSDANVVATAASDREQRLELKIQELEAQLEDMPETFKSSSERNIALREELMKATATVKQLETRLSITDIENAKAIARLEYSAEAAAKRELELQESLDNDRAKVERLETRLRTTFSESVATCAQMSAPTTTATTTENELQVNPFTTYFTEVGQQAAIGSSTVGENSGKDIHRELSQIRNSPLTPASEHKLTTLENPSSTKEEVLALPDSELNAQLGSLLAGVAEREVNFRNLQLALSESSFREENLLSKFVLLGDTLMERDEYIEKLQREAEISREKASSDIDTLRNSLDAAIKSNAKTEDELKASSRLLSSTTLEARELSEKLSTLEAKSEAASEDADRALKSAFDTAQSLSQELEITKASLASSTEKQTELKSAVKSERQAHALTSEGLKEDLRVLKEANEVALEGAAVVLRDRETALKVLEKEYGDAVAAKAAMAKEFETKDAALARKIAEIKQERDLWSAALQEKREEASRREIELQEREETARAACTEAGKVTALSVEKMAAMEKKVGDLHELTAALRRENAEAAERDAKALASVAADADELATELATVRRQRDVARAEALQMRRWNNCDLEFGRGLASFEVEAFRAGGSLFAQSSTVEGEETRCKIPTPFQTDELTESSAFETRVQFHQGLSSL